MEHRVGGRGGQPILPRSLLGLPGMAAGLGGLFATMAIFGGWLFSLALELQDALGESPLRAGLTFVPCGVAFALVSLNWRRLPARYHEGLAMAGFVLTAVGLLWSGLLIRSGDAPGPWLYVALAVAGGGMAAAFGRADDAGALPGAGGARGRRQRRGRDREPARDRGRDRDVRDPVPEPRRSAARRGGLGARARRRPGAFALSSAHAYLAVSIALAALAAVGVVLALAPRPGRAVAVVGAQAAQG